MEDFYKLAKENTTYTDVDILRFQMEEHIKYKTCVILLDENKNIYAFCRWNIINDQTAEILDCVVRDDYRDKGVIFDITRKGLMTWPMLKWIQFERGYDDGTQSKTVHRLSIERFLRRDKNAIIS